MEILNRKHKFRNENGLEILRLPNWIISNWCTCVCRRGGGGSEWVVEVFGSELNEEIGKGGKEVQLGNFEST